MADNGYIKLHRKMLNWEWYDDANTMRMFIHCLLKANYEPTKWHGEVIEAGEFVTSLETLAKETSLSVRQVRVALDHLKMTGEVTSKCQSKYRVITVNSWNDYQGLDKQLDKQMTSKRQADDKQVTTVKEIEEDKEIKKKRNNNNIYNNTFDAFWDAYPRKQDKARAYKCYLARLKDGYTEDQLLTACKNYAAVCEQNHTEQRYIKQGATFLSVNEPFLDFLEMPKVEESQKKTTVSKAVHDKIHSFPERDLDLESLKREFFGG